MKANIKNVCNLLLGIIDVLAIILILLPLCPQQMEGYVASVSLISYTDAAPYFRIICWGLYILLILTGTVKILLCKLERML